MPEHIWSNPVSHVIQAKQWKSFTRLFKSLQISALGIASLIADIYSVLISARAPGKSGRHDLKHNGRQPDMSEAI